MKKIAISAAALFSFSGTAQAQMVRAQDPSSVVRALQGAGYKAEMTKDEGGDPLIRSTSSGSNFAIFFFGCTKNVDCRTIQFFAGYDRDKSPSLSQMNDWNSRKRFGRAYVSDKGAARIEMDVDLDDGGISTKLFEDNLEFWVLLMAQFEKHIDG
ncbi:MAG: YbjN domain-containing protein [Sphingomonadales bacterium]|nr:YbjN domain-containing protein [Sphingomonadales bacterium]